MGTKREPRTRYILNPNAKFVRVCGGGQDIHLAHFGHSARVAIELDTLMADMSGSPLEGMFEPELFATLKELYLLIPEEEASYLQNGLTEIPEVVAGIPVPPRLLGTIPRGSFCLFGVPVDTAVVPPFSPAHGPNCIRKCLAQESRRPYREGRLDLGDVRRWPDDGLDAFGSRLEHLVKRILHVGAFPAMMGGDHATSYYSIRALSKERTKPFYVVHLDAHSDFGSSLGTYGQRNPLNHANVMQYANELDRVAGIVQIGVRTNVELSSPSVHRIGVDEVRKGIEVTPQVPPGSDIYLTIDMDVLDPTVAPEVTTPVFGGLTGAELMSVLGSWASTMNVIGCDVVEVCAVPTEGNEAARIAAEIFDILETMGSGRWELLKSKT